MTEVKIDPRPQTYDEALQRLIDSGFKEDVATVHFFGGMTLRNEWGMWDPESPLAKDFKTRFKLWMADDMSGLLLSEARATVLGEPFDRQAKIDHYHAHWRKHGFDPYTGERVSTSKADNNSSFSSEIPASTKAPETKSLFERLKDKFNRD